MRMRFPAWWTRLWEPRFQYAKRCCGRCGSVWKEWSGRLPQSVWEGYAPAPPALWARALDHCGTCWEGLWSETRWHNFYRDPWPFRTFWSVDEAHDPRGPQAKFLWHSGIDWAPDGL
jgi:hypothetical protein